MDTVSNISTILTPLLGAGMLFFIHRYIRQNDKAWESLYSVQSKLIRIENRLTTLAEMRSEVASMGERMNEIGLDVERALAMRSEIDKLSSRDDLLWEEIRKKSC